MFDAGSFKFFNGVIAYGFAILLNMIWIVGNRATGYFDALPTFI